MKQFLSRRGHLLLEAAVLLLILALLLFPVQDGAYRRYATDTLRYERAAVLQVLSEELSDSSVGSGQKLGVQRLLVELPGGETVTLDNYLTETHNILTKAGQRVVICVDAPENVTPYYTVYSYDQLPALLTLAAVFLLLMLFTGGRKGLDACLSIGFSLVFLLRAALPALYQGRPPILVGLLTVLAATAVTLTLLHGLTRQCLLCILVTLLGVLAASLLFGVFSGLLHLTGLQSGEAEGLLLIAQNTGLQVRTLLFAGMMLASLGAVMDVAVSILSALREVAAAAARPVRRDLLRSGLRMGRDMTGTMSNTLIFAFAGSALTTMLVFYSYGVQANQLLNSNYLVVELAQGLCSTAAVLLTVPAAALTGAAAYGA